MQQKQPQLQPSGARHTGTTMIALRAARWQPALTGSSPSASLPRLCPYASNSNAERTGIRSTAHTDILAHLHTA